VHFVGYKVFKNKHIFLAQEYDDAAVNVEFFYKLSIKIFQ